MIDRAIHPSYYICVLRQITNLSLFILVRNIIMPVQYFCKYPFRY